MQWISCRTSGTSTGLARESGGVIYSSLTDKDQYKRTLVFPPFCRLIHVPWDIAISARGLVSLYLFISQKGPGKWLHRITLNLTPKNGELD
jgi:hypothetical protein